MKHRFGKLVVISLGGSILYNPPQSNKKVQPKHSIHAELDLNFLKKFNKFLRKFIRKGFRFIVVVGGGRLCRHFQDAAATLASISDIDKDWIGIHATRLNAQLLGSMLRDVSDPVIFDCRHKTNKLKYPITVASGWRPGWSTDYVSIALAYDFKASEVIVAGKPSHVYEADPVHNRKAKPIEQISWTDYRKLVPKKWIPGFSSPVDPVAAKLAQKEKVKAIIINGKNLKNFDNLLQGKAFQGTMIQ